MYSFFLIRQASNLEICVHFTGFTCQNLECYVYSLQKSILLTNSTSSKICFHISGIRCARENKRILKIDIRKLKSFRNIAPGKVLFFNLKSLHSSWPKNLYFSFYSTKMWVLRLGEALLMSTQNVCFLWEIRKLFTWYPLLSRPI